MASRPRWPSRTEAGGDRGPLRAGAGAAVLLAAALVARPAGRPAGEEPERPGRVEPGREIAVVVSRKNRVGSLSAKELRRIFLRQRLKWPSGERITVYEWPSRSPFRRVFSLEILGKEPGELKEYWLNLKLTRGLRPPRLVRSPTLLRQYLKRVKGGIGYLDRSEVDETMRIVHTFAIPPKEGDESD